MTAKAKIKAVAPWFGSKRKLAPVIVKRHGDYKHDFDAGSPMFGDSHEQLADSLSRYQHARIVVSYYDCERVRELYKGWTFIDCKTTKNLHSQNGRGARKKEAPELLIVNRGAAS